MINSKQISEIISKYPIPNLRGRTIIYDYDDENYSLFVRWEDGFNVSEDHGDYILDLNINGDIIGIEILNIKIQ